MESNDHTAGREPKIKRARTHEGPKNHIIAFGISIILTMLAFAAVANEALSPPFVIFLIVTMAVIQAVVQVAFWMHAKDKGHFMPVLFLSTGAFVAFTAFIMALYWVWW